jgi:hypothetical protein
VLIALSTFGTYEATNQLLATSHFEQLDYAMLPLSELGSPACTRATRGLVAAAEGNTPEATPEQRGAYELAAAGVLAACA